MFLKFHGINKAGRMDCVRYIFTGHLNKENLNLYFVIYKSENLLIATLVYLIRTNFGVDLIWRWTKMIFLAWI